MHQRSIPKGLQLGFFCFLICTILVISLREPAYGAHKHMWTKETVTRQATCTKSGVKTKTCKTCKKKKTRTITKKGHTWNKGSVTRKATCTKKGQKTFTCKTCKKKKTAAIAINPKNHTSKLKKKTNATCEAKGYTGDKVCTACGKTLSKGSEVPALGHKYTTNFKKPTTALAGSLKTHCSRCGKVKSETTFQPLDKGLVFYASVVNGQVIDLVSGNPVPQTSVAKGYFTGGALTLPETYSNFTWQMILDYNESSDKGVISNITYWSNSGKYEYCDNVFMLKEISDNTSRGRVIVPWVADSWNSGYYISLPIQLYAHVSTTYEYLPKGDSFWSFSMDSANGVLNSRIDGAVSASTMKTYVNDAGETVYVSKKLPASLKLTDAHKIKEIKVYNKALTPEAQEKAYQATGIKPGLAGVNKAPDGLTDLGTSLLIRRQAQGSAQVLASQKAAGTYSLDAGNGRTISYQIRDFTKPDLEIDNSIYESVHIINEPETMEVGKQYPLNAYPYPFYVRGADNSGKADQFDLVWTSSNPSVLSVTDGLLIAKKAGTATITARLTGTTMTDTVTIKVVNKPAKEDLVWNVPADYVSPGGYSFSSTDYESTTHAIYEAIDQAAATGYNHVIFPKQNFYAVPLATSEGYAYHYMVPSNMTIEFPKGSVFYMMDNELSRGNPSRIEIHYFDFGVSRSDYTNTCTDSHLIMDTYYGERYNTSYTEKDYLEEMRLVNLGRKAINCSVEIRQANATTGYFIVADGTGTVNKKTGVMHYNDFVSGRLDDSGNISEDDRWISTCNFITVPDYGSDGYFISADGQDSYSGKYWGGCSARLYDILWFDQDYRLILTERFQGRSEYYSIPDGAAYYKVSLQQKDLPLPGTGETPESPWMAMHDDGSAKNCEIKNTTVANSATGVFSIVGETDGLWIHDNYTAANGKKPGDERTGDIENGWYATRNTVFNNNYFYGYFATPSGVNNFIHTNYLTFYNTFSGEEEITKILNNTIFQIQISEKVQAHIYNNTMYKAYVDGINKSYGHIYQAGNNSGKWVNSY